MIATEIPGAIGSEFRQCSHQLSMGMSVAGVMRSLMRRVRSMEIRILATTLMVHRQTGGNLALTLERMSGVIRDRLNYHRQMRATTGAGRMSSILIGVAGPLTFLVLFFWQFDHLQIMLEGALGQALLAISAVLEIVGMIWIANLLKTND